MIDPKTLSNKEHYECEVEVLDNMIPHDNLERLFSHIIKSEDISLLAEDIATAVCVEIFRLNEEDVNLKNLQITKVSKEEPFVARRSGVEKQDSYVTVVLNSIWHKWCGGEFIVFEKGEAKEIISAHPGRVIVSYGNNWIDVATPKHHDSPLYLLQFQVV